MPLYFLVTRSSGIRFGYNRVERQRSEPQGTISHKGLARGKERAISWLSGGLSHCEWCSLPAKVEGSWLVAVSSFGSYRHGRCVLSVSKKK